MPDLRLARKPSRPLLVLVLALCLQGLVLAAGGDYYRLPGAGARVSDDAITIDYGPYHETYVLGLGWLSYMDADPPLLVDGEVFVNSSVLTALGVTEPRLEGVRYSVGAETRVVLDVPGLPAASLADLRSGGSRGSGEALLIRLPPMLLPVAPPDDVAGLELEFSEVDGGVLLSLRGPAFDYAVLPLAEPTRLVIDVMPQRDLGELAEEERQVAPGVVYRKYRAVVPSGASVVHVVSIAPGAGQFRVVGESRVPRTVTQLGSGALVALNAGYFDTNDFAAIGLLKVDYGLLSLPSRGRAGVAFTPGSPPLIDRLDADVLLHTSRGTLPVGTAAQDGVTVARTPGALVGTGAQGVLVVQRGAVLENKVGPRRVPDDGFALAYPPTNRELALLDTGDAVSLDTRLQPSAFDAAQYAVEAGPLLVRDGAAAYDPAMEGFASGQRILDGLTQQAAVGVMPDGTTLLVVAETMRAADLVPLFLGLGADRAMRFDSGSSTTLVVDGEVVNRRTERKVVSAVVFIAPLAARRTE